MLILSNNCCPTNFILHFQKGENMESAVENRTGYKPATLLKMNSTFTGFAKGIFNRFKSNALSVFKFPEHKFTEHLETAASENRNRYCPF